VTSKVRSTNRIRVLLCGAIVLAAVAGYQQIVGAQSQPRALITKAIVETQLATLAGNTRPEANAADDRGPVAADFPLTHMLLQLRRAPEQEQTLDQYIEELEQPKSANYHHWLTAKEVGEPPLVLANSVFFAIKAAIRASRLERNLNGLFRFDAPATVQEVRRACEVSVNELN